VSLSQMFLFLAPLSCAKFCRFTPLLELLSSMQILNLQGADDPPIEESYCQEFSLRSDMIPSYLPARLLHMIVFIGELVDMFENNENHKTKSEYYDGII